MSDTFPCPACGAPNEPEAGAAQMTCSYCGANLTIPAEMRRAAPPKAEKTLPKATPIPRQEVDASEILRQAQPVAAKAWNAYASWMWIRRVLPTCLVILLIGLCVCAALTVLPFILNR
jgi:hypothetical protein